MKLSDTSFNLFKYKMETMIIMNDNLPEKQFFVETNMITAITIEKNYDNYLYPFFEVEASLPNWVYRIMKKDNQKNKCYLDFQKGQYADEKQVSATFTSYLKDTFFVFMDDSSPEIWESAYQNEEQADESYLNKYNAKDITTTRLLLYKEDKLFNSQKVVNAVLTSTTLLDAFVYTCNQAGLSQVLLSPPANFKRFSEFRLTPIPAIEQCDRICNKYAMHKNGTVVFLDFDKFYVVERSVDCKAFEPNENKVCYLFTLVQSTTNASTAMGCFSNGQEKYDCIFLNPDSVTFRNMASVNEKVFGNNAMVVDTTTGSVSNVTGAQSAGSGVGTTGVYVSNQGGDTSSALSYALKESAFVGTVGFSYVDLDLLAPNKQYFLTIDDTKHQEYNGRYRICGYTCAFVKEGQLFCPTVTAEFRG